MSVGGFIVLPRRLRRSDVWRALNAEQKGVLTSLVFLANWKTQKAHHGGRPYDVHRGELAHALESIAEEAGCSVKVVRTVLKKLLAPGSGLDGASSFLSERYPISGTGPGTGPRVLTIVNYEELQSFGDDEGTGSGTERARVGHGLGTAGAQREPREPREHTKPLPRAGARETVWDSFVARHASSIRPDIWTRWIAPLRFVSDDGSSLVLQAPDDSVREFVVANYAGWITEGLLAAGNGRTIVVRVDAEQAPLFSFAAHGGH